jgi:glutamine---fructose-6-phosphate transaminase (isomerizing)
LIQTLLGYYQSKRPFKMCGIVGAVAERNVVPILIAGLKRLEYRGYDSAGLAVLKPTLARVRVAGKVCDLESRIHSAALSAPTGIAHTRWATHGKPTEANAHPHISQDQVAVVHNGIIENYRQLRTLQEARGYIFTSDTDTEVIVHEIHFHLQQGLNLREAVSATMTQLQGAYALGVLNAAEPGVIVAARRGSPLVIGVGIGEYFIASDIAALLPVTQQFIFLEEGDVAELQRQHLIIYDASGKSVQRAPHVSELQADAVERGEYRHYMLKEIFEQSQAISHCLEGRLLTTHVPMEIFGPHAPTLLPQIKAVQIIACGSSYHAGLVARYWIESLARIPCQVEVASEFRYRNPLIHKDTLIVAISQSGETADTLAAVNEVRRISAAPILGLCNVPESALARSADMVFMLYAGPEIGVASTKAFSNQLVALLLLTFALAQQRSLDAHQLQGFVQSLLTLPRLIQQTLALNPIIEHLAQNFADKHHALFLGRGAHYPIALEGALKLKEISYIHAEAYPAGELKHGPLALVDANMPVIAVAPNNALQEKLKSNLEEVHARGGRLLIFANHRAIMHASDYIQVVELGEIPEILSPLIYTIPLQLLAYHVALIKGTDVDQPRNLAKSVTVE